VNLYGNFVASVWFLCGFCAVFEAQVIDSIEASRRCTVSALILKKTPMREKGGTGRC
jgi:hypothetical protein